MIALFKRTLLGFLFLALWNGITASPVLADQPVEDVPVLDWIDSLGGAISPPVVVDNFLYFTEGRTFRVVERTDPNRLTPIGELPLPQNAEVLAVHRLYAYLVSADKRNLFVVDVATTSEPRFVTTIESGYIADIALTDDELYILTGSQIIAMDNTTPDSPFEIAPFDLGYHAFQIEISGNLVYAIGSKKLSAIDFNDPSSPAIQGIYQPNYAIRQYFPVADNQAYLWSADNTTELYVLDLSNSQAIQEVTKYSLDKLVLQIHALAVTKGLIYLFDGGVSFKIIELPETGNPRPISKIDRGLEGLGYYNTNIMISQNTIYISNPTAIWLIEASDLSRPFPLQVYRSTTSTSAFLGHNGQTWFADGWGRIRQILPTPEGFQLSAPLVLKEDIVDILPYGDYNFVLTRSKRLHVIQWGATAPRKISTLDLIYFNNAMAIGGHYIYIVDLYGNISFVDISTPYAPVPAPEVFLSPSATMVHELAATEKYLYIWQSNFSSYEISYVRAMDLTNPLQPIDAGIVYTSTLSYLQQIMVSESKLYLLERDRLLIYDANDPGRTPRILESDRPLNHMIRSGEKLVLVSGNQVGMLDASNPDLNTVAWMAIAPASKATDLTATDDEIYIWDRTQTRLHLLLKTQAQKTTINNEGGIFTPLADITYIFGPSTLPNDTEVEHLTRSRTIPAVPASHQLIKPVFRNTARDLYGEIEASRHPYTVTIRLGSIDPTTILTETLGLYYWNGTEWRLEPSSQVLWDRQQIVAHPSRFGVWSVLAEVSPDDTHALYLPLVSNPPADLSIQAVEVTQAIQSLENDVPLVAGRPTVVRVYAQTTEQAGTGKVRLLLHGSRNGTPLPGSPQQVESWAVFPGFNRSGLAHSFNVSLPLDWTQGTVDLVAAIEAPGLPEPDLSNNQQQVRVTFQEVPPLELMLVPIEYIHAPTGRRAPAPTKDTVSDWVFRSFPLSEMHVSIHSPITYHGDIGTDDGWGGLATLIYNLKQTEGAPRSQVYYGVIPQRYENGEWVFGRYGGMAFGPRTSMGFDEEGFIAAHELGHNFGLRHAPCGNPPGPDPDYPYPNASIGEFGVDVFRYRIWTPDAPDFTKDVMSYCGPRWFSGYNYTKLFVDQIRHGARSQGVQIGSGLLVQADLRAQPTLGPSYLLTNARIHPPAASEAEADTESYTIELVDKEGSVLLRQEVQEEVAQEDGLVVRGIHALLPLPEQPVTAVRLLHAGTVLDTRSLTAADAAKAAELQIQQGEDQITLQWGDPRPALVRYTADDGASWITLGMGVQDGGIQVDLRWLPGGQGRFQVILPDTLSPPLSADLPRLLEDTPPLAWITGPETIAADQPLVLMGHVSDLTGPGPGRFRWWVAGALVAAGQILQLQSLAPGVHTIEVEAEDSRGHRIRTTHTVTVRQDGLEQLPSDP